ncbi:MAG: porin family protein [Gammaproteobacteria bacterium]|nr:porin family protein [Gammaproteobacteria bacterium]MBT8110343.1 porin family protein [Gammaproteobacteria bacterium]NND47690.1 outer membrane beta-barrel protein [Woeseiaceae bacterium]NNL45046.1 outer membrane beta-barrel protein [Woeseiaceae bacterium]
MLRSSLVLLLLAFAASASAKEFDYNYFSLSYGNIEFDDINVDGDGFGLAGSYAINEDFHVFAGYQAAGLDFGIDVSSLGAGLGYHTTLTPVVDLVASVSYQYIDFDAPGPGDADDNGLGLTVGLRFAASEEIELNAGISYVDFSDSGNDTGFGVGGLYSFTDAFALGLGAEWSDDATSYTLEGRFYFGR